MSDRPTVYVCTSGQYSDFHIDCVFLDRAEAEDYASLTGADIEEYPVGIPERERWVRTLVLSGTKVDRVRRTVNLPGGYQAMAPGERLTEKESGHNVYGTSGEYLKVRVGLGDLRYDEGPLVSLCVSGENFERVRKVFSERWAQVLAEWPLIRQAALDGATTWPIPEES